ncbi:MAG: hypothetical protein ACOXZ5_00245 [Syntrophomonadaceae bacterium]|jgi:archaellum component FlaC
MTNFLPAGIIYDSIAEIYEKVNELKQNIDKLELESIKKRLSEIEDLALDLWVFMEKLPCQPLIYTGQGTTEEVIRRIEWALTFIEEADPVLINNFKKLKGK